MDWLEKTVSDFMSDSSCAGLFAPEDAGRLKAFVKWICRNRMFDAEMDMFGIPLQLDEPLADVLGARTENGNEENCEKREGNDCGGEAAAAGQGEVRSEVHPGGVP